MRAAVQHRYGPPSVLTSSEVGRPLPGRNDVLVQVGAASVHPGDYFVMTGKPYVVRLVFGFRRPRHGIPGRDLAGVVAAVGKDVTALRPGDEVFGWSTAGALAEYACVPADHLVPVPANLTAVDAAAVPTSAMTALQALRDIANVRPGRSHPSSTAPTPSTKQPMPSGMSRPATPEGRSSSPSDDRTASTTHPARTTQTCRHSGGRTAPLERRTDDHPNDDP
ncbi:NAD(P)-dependent alcohol dehydrogenase [Micromonospora sp. DH15]|nr:NAD(P)-dependent alcohol dehydrogenase [Micromonospora sp. DH15]